jgi:DNA-binding transcriptional MerR regulator
MIRVSRDAAPETLVLIGARANSLDMRMEKSADAFRTISEVAEDLDLPQHVLRFWETRFTQIKPLKRAGGRRFYRPDDIELLRAIRQLLYGEGYTIKGVQKILKEQGVAAVIATSRASGAGFKPFEAPVHAVPQPAAMAGDTTLDEARLATVALRSAELGDFPESDEEDAQPLHQRIGESGCPADPPEPRRILDAEALATMEQLLAELLECQHILEIGRRS